MVGGRYVTQYSINEQAGWHLACLVWPQKFRFLPCHALLCSTAQLHSAVPCRRIAFKFGPQEKSNRQGVYIIAEGFPVSEQLCFNREPSAKNASTPPPPPPPLIPLPLVDNGQEKINFRS
ncbi:hypothetical protein Ciccas_002366 [Cichlidogyrus casuarinus]|uniref:Uncharacterized protein n=1 Tax=Cichlidogyrus casuarinus TaxID=1844966 RepID=A0ABD2QJM6_9PLAT